MKFSEVVTQTLAWLQREGRVSYRALKREFELDDEFIEDLKAELIDAKRLAMDEDGKVLVWVGMDSEDETGKRGNGEKEKPSEVVNAPLLTQDSALRTQHSSAERRQLTVLFCDLVGSTALSARLDPEELRDVIRAYQQTCAEVIQRHDGYIAQYLGDGLLVYFGYPTAHEDDARRAVRAGLEIIEALGEQGSGNGEQGRQGSLQVRIGIHTGLVVVGDIGASGRTEQLALGETPNIAARLQGLADPNTVMISAVTQRLIEGQFECQPFGSHVVKGIDTPIAVYHVQSEHQGASLFAGKHILTPLVGREQEVGLLLDRWGQVKEGRGQVVLLSGEPGIGKSRLAYTLQEHVTTEGSLLFEARCSPYYQQSALYPLIEVFQRTLALTRQETNEEKIAKLKRALALYDMQESLPLFTALLSLPTPAQYPPLNFTPQKQKERTLQALVQLLITQAERQATVSVWEDLHWADPSSLEFLSLLIDQIPTSKLLLVLTFRPEFTPPWKPRSHLSQLVLNRLGQQQVEAMIEQVAAGQPLPAEVRAQIRIKTDGVPLFVEELTKTVIEAEGVGARRAVPLQTIPATLQEALMARLDRLSDARRVAQLGATLGREFSYELLQAVVPISETDLQTALTKLVEAEILYQRGMGLQSRYVFKHALIQDTAYQSLLKSIRQQYHQQIARVLEERFPDTKEHQPELVAHHYTEAGLIEQAIPYWQQGGQRALERSANTEVIHHLAVELELLKLLPATPERLQQELVLQMTLGAALIAIKGFTAQEVEATHARARDLCLRVGEAPEFSRILSGLWVFYHMRAELETACQLGEQLLVLAQRVQDPGLLIEAHKTLGASLAFRGDLVPGRSHLEQAVAIQHLPSPRSLTLFYEDPRTSGLLHLARVLWLLGYPEQAVKRCHEALMLARALGHPGSLALALAFTAWVYQFRRDAHLCYAHADAMMQYSAEHELTSNVVWGMCLRGTALAEEGRIPEGIVQMRKGWASIQDLGTKLTRPYFLGLLAEAYKKAGQVEEGFTELRDALNVVDEERWYEAELYRLKGELLLQQERQRATGNRQQGTETDPRSLMPDAQGEAEACFLRAIEIAQQQWAKSWELRASTSLARLWQRQGKKAAAHKLLEGVYNWFTEGFDTKDLQEAKALIEELT